MKTKLRLILAFSALLGCFSFTIKDGLNVTYGVSNEDPSQIELTLNSDFTYSYQDFSNPDQRVKVQGIYKVRNNKIQLSSKDASSQFHDTWRIVADGNAAKSTKGLSLYTLCKK